MRDNVIETLFSLFTSSDRAVAIAGDLIEERQRRGWAWFWLHAVRVTLALWRSAAADAPARVLALVAAGCAILIAPAFGGAAAVGLFPQLIGSPVSVIALSFFWWGGALWTGASLVAIAPQLGMAACATLAAAGEALVIVFGVAALWSGLWSSVFVLYYATALVGAAPLLAGGAIARRRMIAGIPALEQRR